MKARPLAAALAATTLLSAALVSFATPSTATVGSGLIAYWAFEDAVGSSTVDSSGNGNDGTLGTSASWSTDVPTLTCPSIIDTHSVEFLGDQSTQNPSTDNVVAVPSSSTIEPASELSVTLWLKATQMPNNIAHVLFRNGHPWQDTAYGIWLKKSGTELHAYTEAANTAGSGALESTAIPLNTWVSIVYTFDGTVQKLYLNGVFNADDSASNPSQRSLYYDFGASLFMGTGQYNEAFVGNLDEVRLYDRALALSEIQDIASGACGPGAPHLVSYDLNTGSGTTPSSASIMPGGNTTVASATGVSRAGYSFTGWNTASGGTGTAYAASATITPTADTVLYAQWSPNSYTVTYDGNSATTAASGGATSYTTDGSLTLPTTPPTRAGYSFDGWSIAGSHITATSASASVASVTLSGYGNVTATAQWLAATQTIHYDANLGTGSVPADGSYTTGSAAYTIEDGSTLARDGYTFSGWNTAANGAGTGYAVGSSFTGTSSITLYAQWTAVPGSSSGGSSSDDASSSSAGGSGSLAFTGTEIAGAVSVAALLMLVGTLFVVGARRRLDA